MPTANPKITVELGALADPLPIQLKGLAQEETLEVLELDRKAITRCLIMGYMPERQAERAYRKLLGSIRGRVLPAYARSSNA